MPHKSEMPILTLIETLKASGAPANTPEMIEREMAAADGHTQAALAKALKTVKAAGYRVAFRPTKRQGRKPKDRIGPTFVAKFADGTVTRMSTFTSLEKLDWERGERLSIAAYQSRRRTRETPPAIIAARFEQDGRVLAQRNGENAS